MLLVVIMTKGGAESLTGVEDHIAPMNEAAMAMRTMQVRLNTVRFLLFVLAIDNGLAIVHNRKVK